jgi:hypothetical protein
MRMQRSSLVVVLSGFVLVPVASADETKSKVTIDTSPGAIEFRVGNALVGRYHIAPSVAKPYFWPLNAPGGVAVTRAWPMVKDESGTQMDHPHQKSAWFCHGDVIPEGIALKDRIKGVAGVDFWSEAKGHGKIVCTEVGQPTQRRGQSKDHAQVTTRNEWRTADGQKILDETRTIHLHDLDGAYLLVLDIDLGASVCPITFGDTKEGSMGVRVRTSMTEDKGKGQLTNADQQSRERAIWGRRSAWCDYSGPVSLSNKAETKIAGISLFDDPGNSSPACWHSRGYGLMAANPFGRTHSGFSVAKDRVELVKLSKGEHLKLRYGILLHTGDVKEGKVAERYDRFLKLKAE